MWVISPSISVISQVKKIHCWLKGLLHVIWIWEKIVLDTSNNCFHKPTININEKCEKYFKQFCLLVHIKYHMLKLICSDQRLLKTFECVFILYFWVWPASSHTFINRTNSSAWADFWPQGDWICVSIVSILIKHTQICRVISLFVISNTRRIQSIIPLFFHCHTFFRPPTIGLPLHPFSRFRISHMEHPVYLLIFLFHKTLTHSVSYAHAYTHTLHRLAFPAQPMCKATENQSIAKRYTYLNSV